MKKLGKLLFTVFLIAVLAVTATVFSCAVDSKWIAAWGTAPTQIAIEGYDNIGIFLSKVTARSVITPTASGSKLRLRLSNYFGTAPLKIEHITVAEAAETSIDREDATSDIVPGTVKDVTFNGSLSVEIPAGKEFYSDPIDFKVTAMKNIAVSMYVNKLSEINTVGLSGGSTFISVTGGDRTKDNKFPINRPLTYSIVSVVPVLASIDVFSDKDAYSVAVIGDSTITNDFPLYLANKISQTGTTNVGVMGKGILGNRILGPGLGYVGLVFGESMIDRLERDVLSQSNIKYIIVKIGANDVMHPVCTDIMEQYPGIEQPTAEDIIEGFRTVFKMCHDAGKKVIAVGITQWKGNTRNYFNTGDKYVRTDEEFKADWQIALDVNKWLSTTDEHDGYIYYNDISKDPKDPDAFLPEYTVDGAHPTVLLQKLWAENFPLKLVGVSYHVQGVKLNASSAKLNVGTSKKLVAAITPTQAENKKISWKSSNPSVASVSADGTVKALKNGTATITCKTDEGGYTASCKVTVVTAPTALKLSKTSATIYTTRSVKLKATVSPSTATNKAVTWTSSNRGVAQVTSDGTVKGIKAGTATITCKTKDGGLKATCKITVKQKIAVTSIKLNVSSKNIYTGKTYKLTPQFTPSNATFKDVTWKTSNKSVATVDSEGRVKGLKAGTVTITCTSKDNSKAKATCKITVRVKVTGIKLNKTSASVFVDDKITLKATVTPSNATNKSVKWTSSNTKIATVSSKGVVKGIKPGKVTITCTTVNGGLKAKCTVTVKKVIKSKKVTLNYKSRTIDDGKTLTLVPTITPSNTSYKTVTWTSSDKKVAKVSSKGVVKAISPGKATITCTVKDSGVTAKCVITVKAVAVKSVKLNKTDITVNVGSSYKLKPTFNPSNASNKGVTWKSSNPKVATVDANGVVKGVGAGKAKITCTTKDGKKVASCTVTVKIVKPTAIKLNKTSINLKRNKTYTLKATVSPTNATNKNVKWKSSNTKVAKVDSNGKVTAVGRGTATITCTAVGNSAVKAKCKVEVKGLLF